MKPILITLALLLPHVALAQDPYVPPPADEPFETTPSEREPNDRGSDLESLLERGAEGLLNDLFSDVQPHMDAIGRELSLRMEKLGPIFDDLGNLMDDIRNYQAPERLANGDILIRRKADAPPPPPVSEQFQDLTRPAPDMDPRLNPDRQPSDPLRENGPLGDIEL